MLFRSKQKTAYEIVYRDWSSDVCSSDLDELAIGFDLLLRVRDLLIQLSGHS